MSNHDDYIIEVKTVQTNAFKTLCEALKEILTDTNLIFNDDGIKKVKEFSVKNFINACFP